ncbi:Uncharacterised protein [Shigella sonnei]|nr:Uncharacterised protein [Shigella sonnei]CSF36325.1 Uncharacterised protein [Shigella sonnei]CSN45537.1 Uncharacterised protein [Shigella sonnei]CSQ09268.1 Uncharacterised protein [Shigella sonnei]
MLLVALLTTSVGQRLVVQLILPMVLIRLSWQNFSIFFLQLYFYTVVVWSLF